MENLKFYSSDAQVIKLMSREFGLKNINYVYNKDEANDKFFPLADDADWIVDSLIKNLTINANITFVISSSLSPFRVVHLEDDDFVVMIDVRAAYYLMSLCLRLQTLEPLSDITGCSTLDETRDFKTKYLLDITKEIVFRYVDIGDANLDHKGKTVWRSALHFIIAHEIAHVAHGHLEFKSSDDFIQFTTTQEVKNLTLKTLEMDADCSATTSVINFYEWFIEHSIRENKIPIDHSIFKLDIRHGYILGMYIAHLFLDTLTDNYNPAEHPYGYLRFISTIYVMQQVYKMHLPEAVQLIDETRELLIQCFINLSGDIKYLGHPMAANTFVFTGDNDEPEHLYHALGEGVGLEHLQPLEIHWASIRPYLVKYRRGGGLAPVNENLTYDFPRNPINWD